MMMRARLLDILFLVGAAVAAASPPPMMDHTHIRALFPDGRALTICLCGVGVTG